MIGKQKHMGLNEGGPKKPDTHVNAAKPASSGPEHTYSAQQIENALAGLTQRSSKAANDNTLVHGRLLNMVQGGRAGGRTRDQLLLKELESRGQMLPTKQALRSGNSIVPPPPNRPGLTLVRNDNQSPPQAEVATPKPRLRAPRAKVRALAQVIPLTQETTETVTSALGSTVQSIPDTLEPPSIHDRMKTLMDEVLELEPMSEAHEVETTTSHETAQNSTKAVDLIKTHEIVEKTDRAKQRLGELVQWLKDQPQEKPSKWQSALAWFKAKIGRPTENSKEKAIKAFPDIPAKDIEVVMNNIERVTSEPKLQDAILAGSLNIGGTNTYVTNEKLGAGNLAQVRAGYSVMANGKLKDVGIKIANDFVTEDRGMKISAYFAQKMEMANAQYLLTNPIEGVLQSIAIGGNKVADGKRVICYERIPYLEGGIDLEKQTLRMPTAQIVSILSDTTAALDRIHKRGLVHGDLKPENIAIEKTANGTFRGKIIDIGSMYSPEVISGYQDHPVDGTMKRWLTRKMTLKGKLFDFTIPTSPHFYDGFLAQDLKEKDPSLLMLTDIHALGLSIASVLHEKGLIATDTPTYDLDVFTFAPQKKAFLEHKKNFPPIELQELYTLTLQLIFIGNTPEAANLEQTAIKLQSLVTRFEKNVDPYMVSPKTQENPQILNAA